jgi:hypothetical protein
MGAFGRTVLPFAAAFALLGTCVATKASTYVMMLEQVGQDVVGNGNGSIDLTDLTQTQSSLGIPALIIPSPGSVLIGPANSNAESLYSGITGPTSFGPGNLGITASSGNGDPVGILDSVSSSGSDFLALAVPDGYVSGNPLTDSMIFDNQTLAELGLTPGTYVWTWGSGAEVGSGSFTLEIGQIPQAPLPAALPLFATGLGALGLLGWRKKRRPQPVA